MATLADFQALYQPSAPPAGFSLAGLSLDAGLASAQSGVNQGRILRNFGEFDLPDLVSSQAARGAFYSGATSNKTNRLATRASDALADQQLDLGPILARLAANSVLAQTGIQL